MWTICQTCGAVVADEAAHAAWHAAHGDVTAARLDTTTTTTPEVPDVNT